MTFSAKFFYLLRGEMQEWQLWAIHIMLPFFVGLLGYRNMRDALSLMTLSIIIWLARAAYAADQDWDDIQEKMKQLLEDGNEILF